MSEIKNNRSSQQLQAILSHTLSQMQQNQKNANYVQAQSLRLISEQLKKELEQRRVYEMGIRHQQQRNDVSNAHQEQLRTFNDFWDKKTLDYNQQGEKLVRDMQAKHQTDLQALRRDMENHLSFKVKESSEFLNLKKMQEHMARQKLYAEAHKVQLRLQELEKSQKEAWLNARNLKIETSLNTLRAKQNVELVALQKKIKTGLDEQNKERLKQEGRINQKYFNIEKELKANHDKQILAFRGQFRSKGGQGSPLLLNKSKLLSTSK